MLIRPRVFLADDHSQLLEAEIQLLRPHFDIVGTAMDGDALVSEALRLKPDVIIVDITMPVLNGIEAVQKLVQSGSTAKFIFLTIHSSQEFVNACLQAGARGFVAKSKMKAHLISAIYAVLDDVSYVSSSPH
jgi:DNA-binding NarL/FixJ family response regulator